MSMLKYKDFVSFLELNEEAKWVQSLRAAYYSFSGSESYFVEPKTKKGVQELIRADFALGEFNAEEDNIIKFISMQGIDESQYSIRAATEHSGSFPSFYVKFNQQIEWFGKAIDISKEYAFVSAIKTKGDKLRVIADKMTTPDSMKLTGNWLTQKSIIDAANTSIKSNISEIDYQNFMIELVELCSNAKSEYTSVDDLEGVKSTHIINGDLDKWVDLIDPGSVQSIQKDFGEVLGGIFMFSLLREKGEGLTFPEASNLELIDFFFNGLAISSKAGKGAKASSTGYIKAIERSMKIGEWTPSEDEQKVIDDILKPLSIERKEPKNTQWLTKSRSSSTFTSIIDLFESFLLGTGENGWSYFRTFCTDPINSINRDTIVNVFIEQKEKNSLLNFVKGLQKAAPFNTTKKELLALIKAKNEKQAQSALDVIIKNKSFDLLIGSILYTSSKQLQEVINSEYLETLTSLINKSLSVKQLYLDLKLKKDSIEFNIRAMENSQFEFGTLNSVEKWSNNKITISMKK